MSKTNTFDIYLKSESSEPIHYQSTHLTKLYMYIYSAHETSHWLREFTAFNPIIPGRRAVSQSPSGPSSFHWRPQNLAPTTLTSAPVVSRCIKTCDKLGNWTSGIGWISLEDVTRRRCSVSAHRGPNRSRHREVLRNVWGGGGDGAVNQQMFHRD